jgi:hypothetical protein
LIHIWYVYWWWCRVVKYKVSKVHTASIFRVGVTCPFEVKAFGTLLPFCTVTKLRIPHKYLHCTENTRYCSSYFCQRSGHPLFRWHWTYIAVVYFLHV